MVIKEMIVITGLGGSGTRLYGKLINKLGINLGNNINCAYDNLNTFYKTNYYRSITDKFSFKDYDKFSKIFKNQIEESYKNSDKICIKEPNFHILIHMLEKYCKENNIDLKILHIIRDPLYMMKSKNRGQERWFDLFPELEKINYTEDNKYLKYWYLSNKRSIQMFETLKIKNMILYYDNYNTEQCKKILFFLNMKFDLEKFHDIEKKENTIIPEKKENIPIELIKNINFISKYLN